MLKREISVIPERRLPLLVGAVGKACKDFIIPGSWKTHSSVHPSFWQALSMVVLPFQLIRTARKVPSPQPLSPQLLWPPILIGLQFLGNCILEMWGWSTLTGGQSLSFRHLGRSLGSVHPLGNLGDVFCLLHLIWYQCWLQWVPRVSAHGQYPVTPSPISLISHPLFIHMTIIWSSLTLTFLLGWSNDFKSAFLLLSIEPSLAHELSLLI